MKVATLSQETRELDAVAGMRLVEAVADIAQVVVAGGKEITAQQMTERMGFTRTRANTRISEISGGERRRLQLMRLLMSQPNVLLLDEPTNDLDTDTLASMEDLLDTFPGTLVVVSHDRYLLERVTDHQVALPGDGSLRDLPGGVEQYLAMRREAAATPAAPDGARSGKGEGDAPAARRRRAAKNLARIERRMDRAAAGRRGPARPPGGGLGGPLARGRARPARARPRGRPGRARGARDRLAGGRPGPGGGLTRPFPTATGTTRRHAARAWAPWPASRSRRG